jgi:hypothetical protein
MGKNREKDGNAKVNLKGPAFNISKNTTFKGYIYFVMAITL